MLTGCHCANPQAQTVRRLDAEQIGCFQKRGGFRLAGSVIATPDDRVKATCEI